MKRIRFLLLPFVLVATLLSSVSAFARDDPPSRKPEGVLRWHAVPARDGLGAFEGVEDDRDHSEPGVTHIFVEGNTYRFNMDTKQVDILVIASAMKSRAW